MTFKELFTIVFTSDGKVKACGREMCMKMIEVLGDKFGDIKTGYLKMPEAYEEAVKLFSTIS